MANRRTGIRVLLIGLFALVLGACGGGDDKSEPTITVISTEAAAVLSASATAVAASPPASDPTTSATLGANEVAAGEIADRISVAWSEVTSYRAITRIHPLLGTPEATSFVELSGYAERVVILPDTKSIIIRDQGATIEIVLSNGELSKRTTSPGGTAGPWEPIDPATVAANDVFGLTYQTMLAPETPPYSGLSDRQRARIGTDQGTVTIEGRECIEYLFPEVTETGEQIAVRIYLDATDLPCRIETTAGMTISRTDYVFDDVTVIATPVP